MLTSKAYNERYYSEHKEAGLDYLGFGDWQKKYGRWITAALNWKGKRVLDVGCACGSILRGLGEAGVIVQGVDLNEHTIQLGREKWPDMAPLLHVCDAVNLHLFGDGAWQGIHTNQVAEHWRPEHVPLIMDELRRICAPGSLWFCALDTSELYERQGRDPYSPDEDPTHLCLRPLAWWHELLPQHGWIDATDRLRPALQDGADSFLKDYDWDWFVAEKVAL